MIWLAALVVVLASFAVLGVARLACPPDPIDELLRGEKPLTCGCSPRSSMTWGEWHMHAKRCPYQQVKR